ncbi:polyprenol reductase [Plasmodium gonderi]|uniref:Polyprenol reductase n=1 Tax=Plasmodium gonderi TaxID=77519 RepID=A0A1Y1JMS5_PLAGO|nr:polyprenol reductase [Plasmodium gonderi]GAW82527.1 polyprenol reductase [Plasmodium gonderi]
MNIWCSVISLLYAIGEKGNHRIIFLVYYAIGILILILSFYFKSINTWALHGKNLYMRAQKDETKTKSAFSKFKKKIDDTIISKKYFKHFYVVGLVVNSLLLVHDLSQCSKIEKNALDCTSVTNVLLQIQLVRRLFEQLFIVRTTPKSAMHIFSYILGVTFYVVAPFSIYNNDRKKYTLVELYPVTLFLLGTLIQHDTHLRLAKLRPKEEKKIYSPYKVPNGGFFYLVSCPHYFAEILIYLSFLLLNPNLINLLNYTFVLLMLIKNGIQTHNWYLETARKEYPKQRRVIFPYIL